MPLPTERDDDHAYAYSFPQVATRLALSERTVRNMANRGELPCIVVCGKRRITHTALLAYLADRENAATGRAGIGRRLTALWPRRNPTEAGRGIGSPMA